MTGPNGHGIALKIGRRSGINPNSAVFQHAQKSCQGLLGNPLGAQKAAPA